jgi:hypothetical protein
MKPSKSPLIGEIAKDIFLICIKNKLLTCFVFRGLIDEYSVSFIKPDIDVMKRLVIL